MTSGKTCSNWKPLREIRREADNHEERRACTGWFSNFLLFTEKTGTKINSAADITVRDIELYFLHRYRSGIKSTSLRKELNICRRTLEIVGRWDLAATDHPDINPTSLGIDDTPPHIICPYCGTPLVIMKGERIPYPDRKYKLDGYYWLCFPCQAWVGCHRGTGRPLGTAAKSNLRKLRKRVHLRFDPLWKNKLMTRTDAYKWLAEILEIPVYECHTGYFREELCIKTLQLMDKYFPANKEYPPDSF